jgi:Flp pilus assembly protein TadB
MFWIIAAAVVVVLLALAWWSSGRARSRGIRQDRIDIATAESRSRSQAPPYVNGPGF